MHICTACHWSNDPTSFRGGRVFGSQPLHRRRPRNGFPEDSMSNAVKRDATAPVPAVSPKLQFTRSLLERHPSAVKNEISVPREDTIPRATKIEQEDYSKMSVKKVTGRGSGRGCSQGFLTEAAENKRRGKGHGLGIIGIDDLPKAA